MGMNKRTLLVCLICGLGLVGAALWPSLAAAAPAQQGGDSNPPDGLVKLIFIHHSTGENWLADGYIYGCTLQRKWAARGVYSHFC